MQEPATFAWPLAAPPAMANLTHLMLTRTREKTLGILLEHAKSLEHLEWIWFYNDANFSYQNKRVMDLDAICEALGHVRATLTTLKLRGRTAMDVSDPVIELTGSMRGLTKLEALTTLQTTLQFFMGFKRRDYTVPFHECLPQSIKKVCFTDDFSYHEELTWTGKKQTKMVETWWRVKRHQTPNLEILELRGKANSFYRFWPIQDREELAKLGERYGVALRLYTSQRNIRGWLAEEPWERRNFTEDYSDK